MHRILAVFRKDIRHLWLQTALMLLLMALAAVLDPTYSPVRGAYYEPLPIMLSLACWLVIASVIHEEKLPGDRQYWLTRPYGWKELLAAKFLFVAAFVNLPLVLCHAGVFMAVGIPLADQIAPLFWRQVFFTAFYVLPAAALASITRSIRGIVAVALLGGVGVGLAGIAFLQLARRPPIVPHSTNEVAIIRASLLAAGLLAILVLQYSRRRTRLAGGLAVTLAVAVLLPAFFSRRASGSQFSFFRVAGFSLDPDPDRRTSMIRGSSPTIVTIKIPVRLNPIPEGVLLDHARISTIRIESPHPRQRLLHRAEGQLHDLDAGRAWLSIFADPTLLLSQREQPVVVSGSFELQLFSATRVLPLPRGHAVKVPEVGVCRDFLEPEGWIAFSCYSALPHAALLVGIPGARANWIIPPGFVSRSVPTASGFQPLTKFVSLLSYRNWEQVGPAKLVAAEPLSPSRVDFDLTSVLLPAYSRDR